jgi:phosphonate transport system ATP-binding protein
MPYLTTALSCSTCGRAHCRSHGALADLEVKDCWIHRSNGRAALKGISFSARRGEIIAVLGSSGAGKSTLLRAISGVQRSTSGSLMIGGEDLARASGTRLRSLRRSVGHIWQEYNLVNRLTVLENVLLGRLGYQSNVISMLGLFDRNDRIIASECLELVDMSALASRRVDRLSGGERQRVAIARALAQQPSILLADEPTSSLDPNLATGVLDDLRRLVASNNLLLIVTSHQVELARKLGNRVLGLSEGSLVVDMPVDHLDPAALEVIYGRRHGSTVSAAESRPGLDQ